MKRQDILLAVVFGLFAFVAGVVVGTVIAPKEPAPETEEQEIIVNLIIDTPIEEM